MIRRRELARLEGVLSQRPEVLARFAPGATSAEIEAFRSAVGLPLPDDLLAFHAFRDGTVFRPEGGPTIVGLHVLGCTRIVETKRGWDELAARYDDLPAEERRARAHWALWQRMWVPILADDHQVVALATEACFDGPPGQVISFDFEGGGGWRVEHASYADWIRTLTALAEEGLCDATRGADAVETLWRRLNPTSRWIDQEMSPGEVQTRAWPPERVEVPFRPGDTVRIVSGPFGNTPAAFVEAVPDTTRIRVQVRVFGRSAITEVELADVELPAR